MTGLVLEGGTFRGIFSAGFMDGLLKNDVMFEYVIGVSAGISNGVSYVSRQYRRNMEIMENYRRDKHYMGAGNYLKCRSIFGLDFVYDEIPNKLIPFDYEAYHAYKGRVVVGVTNAETGREEYLDGLASDDKWGCLRASCAIPGYFPAIEVDGKPYFDGGIASPICVKRAIKDGCNKNVILLTQPKGFVKKCTKGNVFISQTIRHKYPAMEMPLLARHKLYNDQVHFCEELEKRGKALIFRPTEKLDSFQSDKDELERYWQMGYDTAEKNIDKIREFIG